MQNSTPPTDTAGTFERDVSWLFQPEDVLAHLFFAAAEIGQIQVEVQERTIGAVLAFPHEHSQSIDVLFAKAVDEDVEPGPVRICYHHAGSRFEFLTELTKQCDARRWRLALPNAVSRWTGRGADRLAVRRDRRFQLHLEDETGAPLPQQVYDISATGLSFLFRPSLLELAEGDQVLATLHLPEDHQIPVLLQVRHTRSDAGGQPVMVAGCSLIGLSPWGRGLLNQTMAGFEQT